jgi:hypothetical protein
MQSISSMFSPAVKRVGIALGIAGAVAIGMIGNMGQVTPGPPAGFPHAANTANGNPNGIWTSNRFYRAPNIGVGTSAALTNDELRCMPYFVPNPIVITSLSINVTGAGDATSRVRLCQYGDTGTMQPGSLLLDAGQANVSATGVKTISSLSLAVGPGWYWSCAAQQASGSPPTLTTHGSGVGPFDLGTASNISTNQTGFRNTGVSGACPATFTNSGVSAVNPSIVIGT